MALLSGFAKPACGTFKILDYIFTLTCVITKTKLILSFLVSLLGFLSVWI